VDIDEMAEFEERLGRLEELQRTWPRINSNA